MEVYELNVALEEYEDERRERLSMWRMANYYTALPHMDPKKHIPTVEEFHPFPWDSEFKRKVEFIPYDQQIEFAMKVGRPEWIPDFWYQNSENYQHLARKKEDGKRLIHDGHSGTKGAAKSAKASSRKNQKE
jgi:hypothetical protein